LREQLRRARAKGVQLRILGREEVAPGHATRNDLEALISRWLESRPLATMGFLVDVRPFDFPDERLYLVASYRGKLVGFLAAIPIYARHGFFIEDLLRTREAPNGTAEFLVDAAFRELSRRGMRMATLGLAPLAGDVNGVLKFVRRIAKPFYNFDGVRAFKGRLKPTRWVPQHLAFPRRSSPAISVVDALRAFATGGFIQFGVETLGKQRRLVVLVLGAMLLPWTLLLATASVGEPWFPSAEIRAAWIALDIVLSIALVSLFWCWRKWLVTTLSVATAIDALLTATQLGVWNVQRAHGFIEWVTMFVAFVAPFVATRFLWYARELDTANDR
jgi:hypothetical protein